MEQKKAHLDPKRLESLQRHAQKSNTLTGALAARAVYPYGVGSHDPFWSTLTGFYGKDPTQCTVDEFLCPELEDAFAALAGKELAGKLRQIVALRMEGQFSASPWRRSYRSRHFAFYAEPVAQLMVELIRFSCYEEDIHQRLFCAQGFFERFDHQISGACQYLLALEIRQGNAQIISLLRDALPGEDPQILLTQDILCAIVISGHQALLEDLTRLLLAARLQEGLRQQILEAADKGSAAVLAHFIKVCLENNLFRYSAAIRALDTWTGLGFGDAKASVVQKYAQTAYDCLTDQALRQSYFSSDNNLQAYFALWAQGCHEQMDTVDAVCDLLEDPRHSRKVLGWLFVSRTDASQYQMLMASRHLQERDEELLAWITGNLASSHALTGYNWKILGNGVRKRVPNAALPDAIQERRALFARLKEIAAYIGNKKRVFTGNPFEFVSVTLESEPVYGCMIALAGVDLDESMIGQLLSLSANMSVNQRQILLRCFLCPETNADHRAFLRDCLNDRSIQIKQLAAKQLGECSLMAPDLDALAQSLRSKSSDFRGSVLAVLRQQRPRALRPLIQSMLLSADENQNQAAVELIGFLREGNPEVFTENLPRLKDLSTGNISTQTQILLSQLLATGGEETLFTPENGYGLYDPQKVRAYLSGLDGPDQKAGLFARLLGKQNGLLTPGQIRDILPTQEEIEALAQRLDQVFVNHAGDEVQVENSDGSRQTMLFGNVQYAMPVLAGFGVWSLRRPGARLDMVPFWEEFREALGEYARDAGKMLSLYYLTARIADGIVPTSWCTYSPWYLRLSSMGLCPQYHEPLAKKYRPRYAAMLDIFELLPSLFDPHAVFTQAFTMYRSLAAIVGEENMAQEYLQQKEDPRIIVYGSHPRHYGANHRTLAAWRCLIDTLALNQEDFAAWFVYEYALEQRLGVQISYSLGIDAYFRAYEEAIIPWDVAASFLVNSDQLPVKIKALTSPQAKGQKLTQLYPSTIDLVPQVLDRMVAVEEKRGELPTPLTRHCLAIGRFEGAKHFCSLLAALGKESFFRGYEYSRDESKKAVLSRLLKRCYPAPGDTPQRLAAALKATDISNARLAEAVMYAPQWAAFAEEILGWPGLKCGVWFFHAHINESFSAEKETEVAIYSPISPQQFNDGAFDKNWFLEAYDQLGEKRFQVLYKAAKYITSGSNQHRRSQLYADAVLGKLDAEALMQEITEKRNQEKLRCYPLISIGQADTGEALRRYEFIQKFLKESKQFGAQRRESEKKACATAMENLAITTGLMDVNRLMWQMESQKLHTLKPLMEPVALEGVTVALVIDGAGDAQVAIQKDGKPMKTLPKTLSKNEHYLALKDAAKELKEQKRRAKESLERAMMECSCFGARELQNIWENPVLAPLVKALVWTDGESIGFLQPQEGSLALVALDGSRSFGESLRIAHPHDLKTAGLWAEYMKLLYENRLVQPFKQVFREYYPLTEDERQECTLSRRYAGHQVQPQRTVALLKSRGWTVDYEEGLQKVFYRENLIVRMFAMADWFTPGEIEAPTLETVAFFDRKTGVNVPLEEVPPILFSETMRDLDLVVSVAHVGGVDPEASHSTVEMRAAIARELCRMLGLSNISWTPSHAKIQGALASYSVHLGSGVVHAQGVGMVSILPVHSQARGRIFLPFADDDPKTAEVMSKLLLLCEDKKIKDPSILRQITG